MLNLHSYRWRSFDLVADRGDAVDSALALFRPLRVPSLRRLRVSNITAQRSYEVGYAPGRHMDPVVPFEQFGAHIEELTVGSAFVNWDDRILECLDFSGLKSLNMSSMYIKVGPTMVQLFNIVSKSLNLTTLVCNTFEGQEHPPLPFIVELPALRSLDFVWCGINRLTDFLQHLSAPNLRCFSLKWFCSMTMGIISTLMEFGPDPSEIDAPTPLPATSFLQRLHALRISTPTSSGPERRRLLFYERTQALQGVALPSCYGWFETELSDESRADAWKEQNVSLLIPVLDRAYRSSERTNSVCPHKWVRARCYSPDIFSCLLLERLGERLPGGHKLSVEAKQDIEGMYKDICMAVCEDLRWGNILTAPESPPGLPSLRSNHTQQTHKWRHIDMDMAAAVPGTHAGKMFDGMLDMLRTAVYPEVERRILTDEQKYTPEFLEVLRRHREHGPMS
ncbi:hypothetical protein EWM64_g9975 [Hericium alpestre]|uniref:Uncharacterized protein n=1 Tax=Hericium alpestre TaxID=135208 RepID=A0A4Y9ZJ15_9AGAM|nr:hypothetical protein EWM64_g9975 [Hericium alpestre]